MNKIINSKKRLPILAGISLLCLGTAGLWFYFSAAHKTVIEKTPDAIISSSLPNNALPQLSATTPMQTQQSATVETLPAIPAEMAQQIRELGNRSTDGLLAVQDKNGGVSVDMKGRFQSVSAAVLGPDGQIIIRHGEDFLNNVKTTDTKQP